MTITDVQMCGVLRLKLDICGQQGRGDGGPKIKLFADVIPEYLLKILQSFYNVIKDQKYYYSDSVCRTFD